MKQLCTIFCAKFVLLGIFLIIRAFKDRHGSIFFYAYRFYFILLLIKYNIVIVLLFNFNRRILLPVDVFIYIICTNLPTFDKFIATVKPRAIIQDVNCILFPSTINHGHGRTASTEYCFITIYWILLFLLDLTLVLFCNLYICYHQRYNQLLNTHINLIPTSRSSSYTTFFWKVTVFLYFCPGILYSWNSNNWPYFQP